MLEIILGFSVIAIILLVIVLIWYVVGKIYCFFTDKDDPTYHGMVICIFLTFIMVMMFTFYGLGIIVMGWL